MRAALEHLAATPADRRVAVLGTMAELGPARRTSTARSARRPPSWAIDVLITVGAEAVPLRRRVRRRELLHAPSPRRPARCWRRSPARRPRADQGLALASASSGSLALDGRDPDRGDGLAAHLHLPRAEVHRLAARARVRPAHPRGGARGPPREGGHADDGRPRDLPRGRGAVPDPQRLPRGQPGGVRHGARHRRARLRRRLAKIAQEAARWACRAGPSWPSRR